MTTYLVLGGTGKTGTRLARQLVDSGAIARTGARTAGAAAPGTEPVRFDWDDDTTWAPALAGVEGAYLVPPALRTDHAPLLGRLAEQAVTAGVQRLVLLSARGVDQGGDNPLIAAERAVQAAAGDRVTVVRPSWFMQNFTESFFAPQIREQGVVVAPTADGRQAFIDAEDIAAVALAALTTDGHGGKAYDLSGPEAITFAQAAQVLAEHVGRPVKHVDVPVQDWVAGAAENGLPADYAAMMGGLMSLIRDGHDAQVSPGVEQALGRPAGSFADWAAREASALSTPA